LTVVEQATSVAMASNETMAFRARTLIDPIVPFGC
jgi:hypothetical protein